MKINKAYNNEKLKNALKDKQTIVNALQDIDCYEYDDEDLIRLERYKQLDQFQSDLLYLSSQYSAREIANLYDISVGYIYKKLKEINTLLCQ